MTQSEFDALKSQVDRLQSQQDRAAGGLDQIKQRLHDKYGVTLKGAKTLLEQKQKEQTLDQIDLEAKEAEFKTKWKDILDA